MVSREPKDVSGLADAIIELGRDERGGEAWLLLERTGVKSFF